MYTGAQDELLICRGCLSADGKLFDTNMKRLSLDYSVLIGIQIQEHDGLPHHFCYMCSALLRKFIRFRNKCLNSKHLLEDIKSNHIQEHDGLPHHFCYMCSALLRKFIRFRNKCLNSKHLLEDIKSNHVSKSKLKEFINSDSYCQYTNTQTYEYQPDKDNETEVLFENKDSIKTSIPNVKFKEEIDVSTVIQIKNEDTNFSQNSDLYDSDEQSLVNKYSTSSISNATNEIKSMSIKDNIESDSSDNQSLVTFKSNNKPNTSKKRNTKLHTKKNLVRNFALDNLKSECTKVSQREEKRFESKENLAIFENMYNVDVIVLSKEEQMKSVLDRKKGISYLHSPYKCDLCFKGFMDVDNLTKHCMSQHDSVSFSRTILKLQHTSFPHLFPTGVGVGGDNVFPAKILTNIVFYINFH